RRHTIALAITEQEDSPLCAVSFIGNRTTQQRRFRPLRLTKRPVLRASTTACRDPAMVFARPSSSSRSYTRVPIFRDLLLVIRDPLGLVTREAAELPRAAGRSWRGSALGPSRHAASCTARPPGGAPHRPRGRARNCNEGTSPANPFRSWVRERS